jgi:hypothetical protein
MHLTDAQLNAYIARSLRRRQRRQLDDHLATCLPCTLQLEAAAAEPRRWERRGALQRLRPVQATTAAAEPRRRLAA